MAQFQSGYNSTIPFSDGTATILLNDNAELTFTVPGDSSTRWRCDFSWAYNASVYVCLNDTAVLPAAGTINTSRCEFRPDYRYVRGGDVLHFISAGVAQGGLSLLQLPS